MFQLILYQPEIPPNTGNIIRLCANVGAQLHLVHPLGFDMQARALRRAGLDYHEFVDVLEHQDLDSCLSVIGKRAVYALTTKGRRNLFDAQFGPQDAFLFGPETRGLPTAVLDTFADSQVLRLPMRPGNRSLNLANSAAVVLYEAWRQNDFSVGS